MPGLGPKTLLFDEYNGLRWNTTIVGWLVVTTTIRTKTNCCSNPLKNEYRSKVQWRALSIIRRGTMYAFSRKNSRVSSKKNKPELRRNRRDISQTKTEINRSLGGRYRTMIRGWSGKVIFSASAMSSSFFIVTARVCVRHGAVTDHGVRVVYSFPCTRNVVVVINSRRPRKAACATIVLVRWSGGSKRRSMLPGVRRRFGK